MALCDLQTFVDCLEDCVVIIDESFRVLLANGATLRTFGRTVEEVISQPCHTTFHNQGAPCDSRPFGTCPVQTVRATGQPARVRHEHSDARDFIHTVEIFAAPLLDRERGSVLVVELMREITHQAELEVETAQRHRELTVLNQITSAIARSLDSETLAPELLDLVAAALQADSAAIYQLPGDQLSLVARCGVEPPHPLITVLCNEVAETDTPVASPDVLSDPRWATLVTEHPLPGSLLCIPFAGHENARGMLLLSHARPHPWPEPDIRLATMAARQIAIGLERGRLFHAEAERARSLEQANLRLRALEQTRRQALQRAISAQEDERKRIAAELHDDTAQGLAALIVGLDTAAAMLDHSPAVAREQLVHLKRATGAIIEEIDSIIAALRPALLDDLGLLPALRAYASDRLDPLGVAWEFHSSAAECVLAPPADMTLFRVVQEAINNIARHARAHRVIITVQPETEGITVEVSDDGVGFDVGEKLDPGRRQLSLGLLGMQERLATVNGRLQIQSTPSQGTRLRIFVPCETGRTRT